MVTTLDTGIRLNHQQEAMVEFIVESMRGKHRFIGCLGTAGTGKTFTARYAIDAIVSKGLAKSVGIVAPTNSACKNIKKAIGTKYGSRVTTIAKALSLRPVLDASGNLHFLAPDQVLEAVYDKKGEIVVDDTGGHKTVVAYEQKCLDFYNAEGERIIDNSGYEEQLETLEEANNRSSSLSNYDLLIVDEASMVSKDSWDRIYEKLKDSAKILLLMDQWQLPAVNEKNIYALDLLNNNFRELTKTERYAEDSYIYKVIQASLMAVKRKDRTFNVFREFPKSVQESDLGHGYFTFDKSQGIYSFARQVDRMLQTQKWDYTRCVCWRNAEVDRINQTVRKLVVPYSDYLSVTEGELLITVGNVYRFNILSGKNNKLLYSAATTLVVEKSNQVVREDHTGSEWLVWETIVYDPDEEYTPRNVVILIDQYQKEAYDAKLKYYKERLAYASRKYGYNSSDWRSARADLVSFSEIVDPIRYAYAVTGYGVQGGSYDTIYENWTDISFNKKDIDVRNRTNFVAVSRARKRINVF